MKTLPLVSIIAAIGISLTVIVFIYQYQQNCMAEGGSLVEPLVCDKSEYTLMTELFQKKYKPIRGSIVDGATGSKIEMMAFSPSGDSLTLLIKESRNGPYYAEITCKHKDSGKTETITEDILDYLQNENCFSSTKKSPIDIAAVQRINTDNYLLEILNLQGNYIQNEEIQFVVHEKGFDIRCFSIFAEIFDSSGNKVWEQPQVVECPPGLGKSNFDNMIPLSGLKIDDVGEYRLVVQTRGYEITRTFSVIDQNLVR
jgi:hypothetical protein